MLTTPKGLFLLPLIAMLVGLDLVAEERLPHGLPRIAAALNSQATPEQVELGSRLFFDKRLSRDNSISCASCHDPKLGWSDGLPLAKGIDNQIGRRGSPSLINVAYVPLLFWDGRAQSLEEQIRTPIENSIEMDLPLAKLAKRLNELPEYEQAFKTVYGKVADSERIVQAIATFVRTIKAGNAPFDRYRTGDKDALSASARRGHDVFFFRTNCSTCHRAPLFTDHEFHNLGVALDQPDPDLGRYVFSQTLEDRGAFKTPSLRDIRHTAPYMHDGRFKTLEEVVKFYAEGGKMNPQLDPLMNTIPISDQERSDLVTFLKEGLTSDDYPDGTKSAN